MADAIRPRFSPTELARFARAFYKDALEAPTGREILEALAQYLRDHRLAEYDNKVFLRLRRKGGSGWFHEALRALKRVLDVDMEKPANRKGELPKALGLTSQKERAERAKRVAIFRMMDRLLNHSQWTDDSHTDVVFPYKKKHDAAEQVRIGFAKAEIDPHLTVANILKIWSRHWSESPRKSKTRK